MTNTCTRIITAIQSDHILNKKKVQGLSVLPGWSTVAYVFVIDLSQINHKYNQHKHFLLSDNKGMCLKSIVVVEIKLIFYVSSVVSQYWFTLDFLEELLPTCTCTLFFVIFFNSTTSKWF